MGKDKYLIVFHQGTCGHFLASILEYYLIGKQPDKIWDTGSMHNVGDQHRPSGRMSHDIDIALMLENKFKDKNPTVILIQYDSDDIDQIAQMGFYKHVPAKWSEETYNEQCGSDWPPYSENLLNESEIVKNEIIERIKIEAKSWLSKIDLNLVDLVIEFKTIIGKNSISLNQQIAEFFNKEPNIKIQEHIITYQNLNRRLYGLS